MALLPLNDYCKIQLDAHDPLSAKAGDSATSGILVELPKQLTHFGFYSFAFEDSFMNEEKLAALLNHWKQFTGKRVFWLALAEKGAILKEEDGTSYAYVKLTSLMAVGEANEKAESVLDARGGAFAA